MITIRLPYLKTYWALIFISGGIGFISWALYGAIHVDSYRMGWLMGLLVGAITTNRAISATKKE